MSRIAVLLALIAGLLTSGACAQSNPTSPGASNQSACLPATTLDELTKALDDAVSGPGNKDRTCLRELLLPGARLTPLFKSPDGTLAPRYLTVLDWINAVAHRGTEEIYERQMKVTRQQYGHMAQLWSEYEIRLTPEGKATVHGVNSIQAVFDGSRWKVIAILWETEATAGSAPVKNP
jgi:hypothetical protein